MSLVVDLSSPNERTRRSTLTQRVRTQTLEAAKKAQIESQVAAKERAEKRKQMTTARAQKRREREEAGSDDERPTKKAKKNEGRIIDYTERDHQYITKLFHTNISYFGNVNVLGLFCGYDSVAAPVLVYPIVVGPATEKKQSIYDRKFILGVGRAANVITGIKQAFTELYPHLPADRVYDWKLMKWNRKLYKAATLSTAVDPSVLSQRLFSSKSFGGAGNLQPLKITDDLTSTRKMECAIEVARYIKDFVPQDIKNNFPGYTTISFEDVLNTLSEATKIQKTAKEAEKKVEEAVNTSDIIKEAFEKNEASETESDEDEDEEEEESN